MLSRVEAGTQLVFRFEPFILAVECRDMATAQVGSVAAGRNVDVTVTMLMFNH